MSVERSFFSSLVGGATLRGMTRVPARWCAAALFGVVLACTTSILAQPAPAGPKPGAAPADPAKLEKAKEHMAAGSLLYNDPSCPQGAKCEAALVEFEKAYELSGSWKALRAVGICELKLERNGAALTHFEQVLAIGGDQIPKDDKTQINNDIKTLKTSTAYVKITTNQPNAKLSATRQPSQGLPVTNRYAVTADGITVGVHPGSYVFTASSDGFPDVTWQAEVPNGSQLEHHFELALKVDEKAPPPKAEMERPVPITVWIFTGLSGACAVTSGTFMVLSKLAKDEYDDQNGVNPNAQELEDMRQDVVTKNIVADVFIGVTAASFAATLIFYFTRPEVPVEPGRAAWTVVPQIGPEVAGATFVTSF